MTIDSNASFSGGRSEFAIRHVEFADALSIQRRFQALAEQIAAEFAIPSKEKQR